MRFYITGATTFFTVTAMVTRLGMVGLTAFLAAAQPLEPPAFSPSLPPEVARPVADDVQRVGTSVTDFGARCDGVTDDTAAIVRAINALGASVTSASNGRILRLPRGTCVVASPIAITNVGNVIVQGEGGTYVQGFKAAASRLLYTGTASPFLKLTTNYARGWQFRDLSIEYGNRGFSGTLIDVRTPGVGFFDVTLKGAGVTASMADLYTAEYLLTVEAYEAININRVTFANARKHLRVHGRDSGPLNIVDSVFYTATQRFLEVEQAGNFGINIHRNFFDVSINAAAAQIAGDGIIIKANGFDIAGNTFSGYTTYAPSGAYLVLNGSGSVRGNAFRTNYTAAVADSVTLDWSGNFIFAKKGLEVRASATVVRGGGNHYAGANSPDMAVDIAPSYRSGYATVDLGPDSIDSTFSRSYSVNAPRAPSDYVHVNGVLRYSPSSDSSANGPILNASVRLDNIAPAELAKAGDYTLRYRDCGRVISNAAANGPVVFTLPPVRIGCRFTFLKLADKNVTIRGAGRDAISFLNLAAPTAANTARSNLYAEVTLQGHQSSVIGQAFWRVETMRGEWKD